MARLSEHQGKEIFAKNGIVIPRGKLAESPQEARKIAEDLGTPVAIKAQVLSGKRGKGGGIKFAYTIEEVEKTTEEILSSRLNDAAVEKVLVEEMLDIKKES